MKLKVVFEKEDVGGYSVYVPELPGCTSQGETKQEAISNIKEAIKLYLWSIQEDKRSLQKNKIFFKDITLTV